MDVRSVSSGAMSPARDSDSAIQQTLNLTFISIHDLTPEATVLYSSESVLDVLGYTPEEVIGRSAWDFFPPEELPHARAFHKHGIEMDKAAMLAYCRVKDRYGTWIGCESCFTICHDVMIVCTSIYRTGMPSQKRAAEAPVIRRLFASSPRDPRYHMLSHISHKFESPAKQDPREPRAALFLNRFTRTLTIMYATEGIEDILGIPASGLRGKSFYYCIEENCLADAVKCLENAKGNDSIAYLRFWFRDPRNEDPEANAWAFANANESDEEMTTDAGADTHMNGVDQIGVAISTGHDSSSSHVLSTESMDIDRPPAQHQSRTSSGDSGHVTDSHEAIFGTARASVSSSSSAPHSPDAGSSIGPVEIETVVSCASDGLVVCLRRARPMMPSASPTPSYPMSTSTGIFAAPWADDPIVPTPEQRQYTPHQATNGVAHSFAPSLGPQGAFGQVSANGPDRHDFMTAIRDQAIFAWALSGINGSIYQYGSGKPRGESVPANGMPIWESDKYAHSMASNGDMISPFKAGPPVSERPVGDEPRSPTSTRGPGPTGNDHRSLFGDPGIKHVRQPSFGTSWAGHTNGLNGLHGVNGPNGTEGGNGNHAPSGSNAAFSADGVLGTNGAPGTTNGVLGVNGLLGTDGATAPYDATGDANGTNHL